MSTLTAEPSLAVGVNGTTEVAVGVVGILTVNSVVLLVSFVVAVLLLASLLLLRTPPVPVRVRASRRHATPAGAPRLPLEQGGGQHTQVEDNEHGSRWQLARDVGRVDVVRVALHTCSRRKIKK